MGLGQNIEQNKIQNMKLLVILFLIKCVSVLSSLCEYKTFFLGELIFANFTLKNILQVLHKFQKLISTQKLINVYLR